jgi:nucleoside-diphosphate-sugar epimerase
MTPKYLVTGGAGFIGSQIASALLDYFYTARATELPTHENQKESAKVAAKTTFCTEPGFGYPYSRRMEFAGTG